MKYIKVENGNPVRYSIGQLKRDNPNVSFPHPIPKSVLIKNNVFPVKTITKPDFDIDTQKAVEGDAVLENEEWIQTWSVVDLEGQELINAQARAISRARKEAQVQSYIDNMPNWTQVSNVVDSINNLDDAKAFLLKLARVVYWNIKGTET